MRAIVVQEHGGPEVLRLAQWPDPEAGPGQVVVRVAAAGVNFIDIYQCTGVYPVPVPFVPGGEGAGTIVAVGPGVTDFTVGDAVAWAGSGGSYAELAAVPASALVRVPDGMGPRLAAAACLQGLTAHYLCRSTFPVADGTVAVVHAAAGGVGLLLTQLIKRLGGTVVATTSGGPDGQKAALARGAGADHVVGYDAFVAKAHEVTEGHGADVVYDGVGAATFDDSLKALRPRGLLALFGASSGQVPPFDPQRLNSGGSLFLTRPTLGNYIADPGELAWRAGELFGWIAGGELNVRIGGEYPLADAPRAQEDLAGRRTTGKLLLIP